MTRTFAPPVYLALQGILGRETEKAILFRVHAPEHKQHGTDLWFPLSQIVSVHRTYNLEKGTFDVIMASEWILGTKGLLAATSKKNPATETASAPAAMANTSKQERADNTELDEVPVGDVSNVDNPDDWWTQFTDEENPHG